SRSIELQRPHSVTSPGTRQRSEQGAQRCSTCRHRATPGRTGPIPRPRNTAGKRKSMELLLFAISALLSAVSSVTAARLYVWPWLRPARPDQSLAVLVAPHLFLRFIGLSVLIPGVVASALPPAFAVPAAFGDLVAGVLAIVA